MLYNYVSKVVVGIMKRIPHISAWGIAAAAITYNHETPRVYMNMNELLKIYYYQFFFPPEFITILRPWFYKGEKDCNQSTSSATIPTI